MRAYAIVCLLASTSLLVACEETTKTQRQFDGGVVCTENERFVHGECVFVCDRHADCPADQQCNLLTGTCEPRTIVDSGVPTFPCTTGATRCSADERKVEACSEAGNWIEQESCGDGLCINDACFACRPGTTRCHPTDPGISQVCLDDGSAWRDVICQPTASCAQGECRTCEPNTTRCSPDGVNLQSCEKNADETRTWDWENSGDDFDRTCITGQCLSGPPPSCKPPECVPGATRCASAAVQEVCSEMGAWTQRACASLPGFGPAAQCSSGICIDECADAVAQKSYFGCEYWTAVQDNSVDPLFKGGTMSGQGTTDSDFAFAISNRSLNPTEVKIYRWYNGAEQLLKTVNVDGRNAPSKGLAVVKVPWQSIGGASVATGVSVTGKQRYAYRITSTRPVTVYQFSPLDASKPHNWSDGSICFSDSDCVANATGRCTGFFGTCQYTKEYSYSNDASLLLPAHILGTQYVAVSHEHMVFASSSTSNPSSDATGHLVLVGTQNGTNVTLKSSARTVAGGSIPGLAKGQTVTLTLNAYDVIQIATANLGNSYIECAPNPFGGAGVTCRVDSDLTGSVITSDKPIAVFGGAACGIMPNNAAACDHLEEQVFPFATWGKTFAVHKSHPVRLTSGAFASPTQMSPDYYKVVASCPASQCPNGTLITFSTPPAAADVLAPNRCLSGTLSANSCRLAGGTHMTFRSKGSFTLTADQPVAVAQIFASQYATGGSPEQGDPSMILLPPAEQWRNDYTVQTAPGIADNFLGIVIDSTKVQEVQVDGTTLTGFTAIAGTSFQAKNHPVSVGVHTVTIVPKPGQTVVPGAGVTVYGFDSFVSYGYTGGLDLGTIVGGINPGG